MVTSDGPYAETKEALTGFYLLECADLDEAIKVAAQIPAAWDGAVEVGHHRIRQLRRRPDPPVPPCFGARHEGRRGAGSTLARLTGDLPLAEDAVQDAAVRALEIWPR